MMLILLMGLAARYLFYISIDDTIIVSDSPTYIDGAMSLYYHLWLNEYRPPAYPLGLALLGVLFYWNNLKYSVVILQILLSLVNTVFVCKLAFEAFRSRHAAYIAALITSVSFRVFSWDFVILSENFAILAVTLVSYHLVMYLRYSYSKNLKALITLLVIAIFTKPFFLVLPAAVAVIVGLRLILFKYNCFFTVLRKLSIGLLIIYTCVFGYSLINYAENVYFGITTVGNVNYFGKILQYKMEDLGSNNKIKEDITYAFKTVKPEYKVNGEYLEPWHFVGTYGWSKNHYREVGSFAREIILKHPIRYTMQSLKLVYRLLVLNPPFKDFIADSALGTANHTHWLFSGLRRVTEAVDGLYILLLLCIIESLYVLLSKKRKQTRDRGFFMGVFMLLILYHYFISAFFSYGDYCRLLAPCYPLIYTIIALYIYRLAAFIVSIKTRMFQY